MIMMIMLMNDDDDDHDGDLNCHHVISVPHDIISSLESTLYAC